MQRIIRNLVLLALASSVIACSDDGQKEGSTGSTAGTGAAGTAARAGTGAAAGRGGTAGAVGVGTAGAAAMCPALRPVEDATCAPSTQTCTYDEIQCQCPRGMWTCAEPVDPNCPAMMPVHDSVCSVPEATECEFLQDECECISGRWSCESAEGAEDAGVANPTVPVAGGPAAGAGGASAAGAPAAGAPAAGSAAPPPPECPDLRPIEGFSCMAGRYGCMYDTTHCVCPEGMWLCSEMVDPTCPIEPPTPDSACTGRADCDFFDIECECLANRWSCKSND